MLSTLDAILHLMISVKLAMAGIMLIFSVWMLLGIKKVKQKYFYVDYPVDKED